MPAWHVNEQRRMPKAVSWDEVGSIILSSQLAKKRLLTQLV